MLVGAKKKNRSRFDTLAEILGVCLGVSKNYRIMYQVNLSYAQSQKYLPVLVRCGLLAASRGEYVTTDKGRVFLKKYGELLSLTDDMANPRPPYRMM